ncbi:glycosyltransferase [Pedobacter mucosus]|uniref:glycosyltransferase n=1 Tax=Pedobacter mucosus TaxID=2895286 RepID=UPI001EE3C6BB|nr:glycosyltransferase [Pedobacter mucosus]UKT64778.1 glycosyltransferase [Pedobacter mucosus]
MLKINSKLFPKAVKQNLKISVIVPVKDEEEFIFNTLEALRLQEDHFGNPLDKNIYEVLILINNSTDESFLICTEFALNHPEFNLQIANINLSKEIAFIGTVRKMMMDEACERLMSIGANKGIIASTDGDSEVDKNWVYCIINEMEKGVDVVGGRIYPKQVPEDTRWPHLRDVTYRFLASKLESIIDQSTYDPWPRHFQCYGASVAVTCEIYQKVGGMPPLPFLEDEEFRRLLKRIDAKIRKSPSVKIYTSSRFVGRVEFGFSVQLKQWTEMHFAKQEQLVESLDSLSYKFINKRKLRILWELNKQNTILAEDLLNCSLALSVAHNWLADKFFSSVYFEGLWEDIEDQLRLTENKNINRTTIGQAISELRMYFSADKNLKVVQEQSTKSNLSSGLAV